MAKSIELLLTESVENLGIVGDVVKVRIGYARNFLLPRNAATTPSAELIDSLKSKRAHAQAEMAQVRSDRAQTIDKLKGYELSITRVCNDQGILYGSVTQQEISEALIAAGFGVRPRDVRLSGAIKRVDNYDVHIKFEAELETDIKLHVKPDRVLAKDEKPDLDFDNEGNLIEKKSGGSGDKFGRGERTERPDRADKSDKPAHPDARKGEPDADDGKPLSKHGDKLAKAADGDARKKPALEDDAPKKAVKKPREDVKKPAAKK